MPQPYFFLLYNGMKTIILQQKGLVWRYFPTAILPCL